MSPFFVNEPNWVTPRPFGGAGGGDGVAPNPALPNPTIPTGPQGPTKAIVFSLIRQVFEPLQVFPNPVRAIGAIAVLQGTRWQDLTNSWSSYVQSWNSFLSTNARTSAIAVDDGQSTTWVQLTDLWANYAQAWNSFPAGGNIEVFDDNSTNDNGTQIPYSMVSALLRDDSITDIKLDSWEFFFKIAALFELITVEFDSLKMPFSPPVPITAFLADLSDATTFGIPKAFPQQQQYSRYIKVTFSGNSFNRAFAFGGGTIFVQVQGRSSTK